MVLTAGKPCLSQHGRFAAVFSFAAHGNTAYKKEAYGNGLDYVMIVPDQAVCQMELLSQLYAMSICLFYLALILENTGAAILATQVLSDRKKKRKQDCLLRQIGMTERHIIKLNNRQLSLLFLLPLLPSLVVSGSLTYADAQKIQLSAFRLPAFTDNLWVMQAFGISFICFLLLYGVYYTAARVSYGRRQELK